MLFHERLDPRWQSKRASLAKDSSVEAISDAVISHETKHVEVDVLDQLSLFNAVSNPSHVDTSGKQERNNVTYAGLNPPEPIVVLHAGFSGKGCRVPPVQLSQVDHPCQDLRVNAEISLR